MSDGVLNLKRWRAGVTNDVSIQLAVIGAYSPTAPFDCPRSAQILSNAVALITNKSFSGAPGGPVLGLALLASGHDAGYPAQSFGEHRETFTIIRPTPHS